MNLKRNVLSTKELALIGILIVLVAYYFVVQGPIKKQTDELQAQLIEINSQMEISQQKAAKMVQMQKAIDSIFEEYNGNPPMTPEYSNLNHIIGELNGILGDTYDYNLSFDKETIDEANPHIVRRPISISFSTKTYKGAVSKIRKINKSLNKYLVQNVSITDTYINSYNYNYGYTGGLIGVLGGSNYFAEHGRYNIVMTMTSFEYREDVPTSPDVETDVQ